MEHPIGQDMIHRRQLYRITEVMEILSLSRSVVYELIRSGRLLAVKEGRSRRVSDAAIADYIALLEREAGGKVA
jgi:excisionase family DNA binding protein